MVIPLFKSLFSSKLRIDSKAPHITQCNSHKESFELILNDLILNILNVKEKTNTQPQSFHDMKAFLTKVFFILIISNYILHY